MRTKIPKILHYCWFGPHHIPSSLIDNIQNWRIKCPEYEIIEWSSENFDVYKNPFTLKAFKQHNWAFISDYVRLYALYKFGGIYLDTDVKLLKSLDPLLNNKLFIGLEDKYSIASGLAFGTVPYNKNIKSLLKIYNKIGNKNKKLDKINDNTVSIITKYFRSKGLQYKNKKQFIDGCTIYPTYYFNPKNRATGHIKISPKTYSIHYYSNSWNKSKLTLITRIDILLGLLIKKVIGPKYYNYLYKWYLNMKKNISKK